MEAGVSQHLLVCVAQLYEQLICFHGIEQPVTRDLWPAPYLVMDTGASIAPYNHIELGQPILTEYVWGRQVGEHTTNP